VIIPRGVALIEIGDSVRELGGEQVFKTVGYNSATKQFQLQIGSNALPIKLVDESKLELVGKARGDSPGAPALIPENWIIS
jgi:hypothetical protein